MNPPPFIARALDRMQALLDADSLLAEAHAELDRAGYSRTAPHLHDDGEDTLSLASRVGNVLFDLEERESLHKRLLLAVSERDARIAELERENKRLSWLAESGERDAELLEKAENKLGEWRRGTKAMAKLRAQSGKRDEPTRADVCSHERCTMCREPAAYKVAEEILNSDPFPRHPCTAYVCDGCFARIMSPGQPEPQPALIEPVSEDDAEASYYRTVVSRFANAMVVRLVANGHKPGWEDDDPYDLSCRAEEEAKELVEAARKGGRHPSKEEKRHILHEAADVANMAMMVADVCHVLPDPKVTTASEHAKLKADYARLLDAARDAVEAYGPHGPREHGAVCELRMIVERLTSDDGSEP